MKSMKLLISIYILFLVHSDLMAQWFDTSTEIYYEYGGLGTMRLSLEKDTIIDEQSAQFLTKTIDYFGGDYELTIERNEK